jgi:hypothetical protein
MVRCTEIAKSTSEQCKNDAIAGERYCLFHKPKRAQDRGHPFGTPGLSEDEQKRFLSAFGFVEQEIYERTLKRVQNHFILVTAIVLAVWAAVGAGIVIGLRDKVVDSATEKLANDAELRKQVADGAQSRIDRATNLLAQSKSLADELEKESARAQTSLGPSLKEIADMLEQIKQEIQHASRPSSAGRMRKVR